MCNTLYITQESTKIKNEIFITAFVTEHLWNITPQSSYTSIECISDKARGRQYSSSEEHVLRKEGESWT